MKILATGGTGYIGSHTVVELIASGHEVEILDNLSNSKESVLDRINEIAGVRPKFFNADICDFNALSKIMREGNYDAVIHFAGLKAVGESVEKPLEYFETNVGGSVNVLKAMREAGINKIIFSSSATVYGDQGLGFYDEEAQTGIKIACPYGETKYMIERILMAEAVARPEFECTILRYFNPIGAHPSGLLGEDPNGIPNNLMPVIMRVSTGDIPELQIYGDDYDTEDGTCIRDYIHVVDLAKGHVSALDKMKTGAEVYNLGTNKGTSVLEMIKAFEDASGKKLPTKVVARRAGDVPVHCAIADKANRELGWKAELDVADACRDTLNYLAHEARG
ncbi:MAG: UDP-glucose 4-epimerase GalE [Candidatus Saccharibacteria bacterium]|nr:UDP-glucose 4-epimerase GalE [Candidatus Saccharibacteria bacterium]